MDNVPPHGLSTWLPGPVLSPLQLPLGAPTHHSHPLQPTLHMAAREISGHGPPFFKAMPKAMAWIIVSTVRAGTRPEFQQCPAQNLEPCKSSISTCRMNESMNKTLRERGSKGSSTNLTTHYEISQQTNRHLMCHSMVSAVKKHKVG